VTFKTWEIEFLDEPSQEMGMNLCDAMMTIKRPANPRFSLFHSIDHHWKDDCYIITYLKSADSLAHAMIAELLPYVKWTLEAKNGKVAQSQVQNDSNWQQGSDWQVHTGIQRRSVYAIKVMRCSA